MKDEKSLAGHVVAQESGSMRKQRKVSFRAEEIFYYLFFAILLFAKGIGLYDGMKEFTICLLAAFLCFAVKISHGQLIPAYFIIVFKTVA